MKLQEVLTDGLTAPDGCVGPEVDCASSANHQPDPLRLEEGADRRGWSSSYWS